MTKLEMNLIRLLQEDFPRCERPFAVLGGQLGLDEQTVLAMTRELQRQGKLKRIGAALHHRRAGYRFNSMIVWDVPEERLDEAGKAAAELPQVSHCYARAPLPEFPYNLYTMVHENSEERLTLVQAELESRIRPLSFCSLRTLRELKKVGMRYFAGDGQSLPDSCAGVPEKGV